MLLRFSHPLELAFQSSECAATIAAMTPYLKVISQEWIAHAEELAQWTYEHMVNRTDVWGSYLSIEKRRTTDQHFFIAPFAAARGKTFLTKALLAKHFVALDGNLISLHSTSADKTSRWLTIDIDRHDGEEEVSRENNLAAAIAWHDRLLSMGFDPLLLDSNGNGGYHVITLFDTPVPTADIYAFGQSVIADWEKRGLARRPETYPSRVSIEEGHFGNCLRLFGRHHTREHFTRVWSGEPGVQDAWLEGAGAIERILQTRCASPSLLPRALPEQEEAARRVPKTVKKNRPRVCVDLDGVLAQYDGWKGLDFTGQPNPGAVEFTRKLSEIAEVVIYTTRCAVEHHREDLGEASRPASDLAPRLVHSVRYWLEKYRFTFDEIYAGQGKPLASAYVDDRAIACTPQNNPQAFDFALFRIKELCSRRREEPPKQIDDRLKTIMERWPGLSEAVKKELVEKALGTSENRRKKVGSRSRKAT